LLPEKSREDQRAKDRYPIALELQYKLLDRGRVEQVGIGRTVNISSKGVLFETDRSLPPSGSVELAMKWPFLLRGICGMKLIIRGQIVRCHANTKATAVRAESHEFRTAGFRAPGLGRVSERTHQPALANMQVSANPPATELIVKHRAST